MIRFVTRRVDRIGSGWVSAPLAAVVFALAAVSLAPAQGWSLNANVADGLQKARESQKAAIIWFRNDENKGERQKGNVVDNNREAIVRALRDPAIEQRFGGSMLPIQANFKTDKELVKKYGVKSLEMVVVAPDGQQLAKIGWPDSGNVAALAKRLANAERVYFKSVYQKDIQPVLRGEPPDPAKLGKALDALRKIDVIEADDDLIALLQSGKLDAGGRDKVFAALADLSTQSAVDELLRQSVDNKSAMESLSKCKPWAAPMLAEKLDGDATPKFLNAYRAAARICKLDPKPETFWTEKDADARNAEIRRIRAAASKAKPPEEIAARRAKAKKKK